MFLNTIKSILSDNLPVLIIFIITMVLVRFFYFRTHREKLSFYKEFMMIISICYIFLLFQLLTKVELNEGSGYNIVPFQEIMRYEFGSKLFVYNVVGNICAFLIFGLIVSCYIKPKTALAPFIISLLVSITVEFVQLNIGRSFDVDDVILNVLGGLLGYLLYVGCSAIYKNLPALFKNNSFYNIICLLIFIIMVLYILSVMGVFSNL